MYEELRKAYDTTADRVWLANCGDLKGAETQISLFLDMAYDIDSFNADNVATYPARWLAKMFGEEYYDTLEDITCSHINLAFPESRSTWAGDIGITIGRRRETYGYGVSLLTIMKRKDA